MIFVNSPGFLTTVQDLGRWGFQAYGMPVAGAMDVYSLMAGNAVVGNCPGAAALEITLSGPELCFGSSRLLCIVGGGPVPMLNGVQMPVWVGFRVSEGDVLSFSGYGSQGSRAWICVSGGVDVPLVMGSRSTYIRGVLGGHEGRKLEKGDSLPCGVPDILWARGEGFCVPAPLRPQLTLEPRIRVIQGPQEDMFTPDGIDAFYTSVFRVGNESDRMGYRLEGEKISHSGGADIISDAIANGAVQIPGHGLPIVMLADRQTTGGYPKIAAVINADLPFMAQMKPGDTLSFQKVSLAEASEASEKLAGSLRMVRELVADHRSRRTPPGRDDIASGSMKIRFDGDSYDVYWEAVEAKRGIQH